VECSGTAESLASQPGVEGLAQISMDGYSLCGLSKEGVAHCWTNRNDVFKRVPPPVGPFSTIVNNNVFACGLRGDGEIECWGIDWGNGSGPESCWIEQTRLSLNGQPERAYWVRFGDDHVADAGFRSSSSDSDNFILLSASAPAALDPRTAAGDAGLTVDTSLWLLDPTEASPGEVYCSGPRANARLERSNDELVLNWSNLSSLGKCPGTEPVAGSLTACPGCASSALSGTLRGEAKNVAESRNTLWPYAPTTNYADGSALILRKNNFNEGKWAVLLTPPDASGVSEVICAGSVSVSKGSGGDMWTLGSFTSLGRCKGGGTSTLKGCMR
jgi:hypothetical protein